RPAEAADPAPSDLDIVEAPLPPQWAWEAHDGTNCRICGARPRNQWDPAPNGLSGPSHGPESPSSDLTASETPLAPERPQNGLNSAANPPTTSPPATPPPRTKTAPTTGGRSAG